MSAQPCRVDTPDAHEHRPHLTLVPQPARKACKRCGVRPKKPGRGEVLCAECQPKGRTGTYSRTRPDKLPKPCIRCNADRVGDPFPYNSRLCSSCAEDRGEDLPKIPCKVSSAPLAAVLERIIAREEAPEPWARFMQLGGTGHRAKDPGWMAPVARREGVCARAGVSPKSLQEWREGRRTTVPWNKADSILQNLGLSWDDVWTPQTTPPDEYRALREAMCCV